MQIVPNMAGWLGISGLRVRRAGGAAGVLAGLAMAVSPIGATGSFDPLGPWYTDAQADRGERAFMTNCIGCHGLSMFQIFMGYPTAFEFHAVISLTMPWEAEGQLPAQWYVDMVAFMMRGVGFPAGDSELVLDREAMERITPGLMRASGQGR